MERLFTYPELLSQLCLHHQTLEPLPAELSAAVGSYYGCKYNSALALSARTAAALAEQMYCEFGGDGDDYWRQAWRGVAGLPGVVAQQGSLREVRKHHSGQEGRQHQHDDCKGWAETDMRTLCCSNQW